MGKGNKSNEEVSLSGVSYNIREKDDMLEEQIRFDKEEEGKDIDYLLDNVIGGGGWGQWVVLLCQLPIGIASGLPTLIHMFAAYEPRHRCVIPNCEDVSNKLPNTIKASFVQFALPQEYGSSEILREDESFNPCKKYEVIEEFASTCSASSFNSSSVIDCNDWVYDTDQFTETLATKENLVCEDEWKRRILGTLMMLGLLVGSIIGGRLGDKFGRKVSILGAHLVMIPVVMFAGYSPNYEIYAVLRFVSATCLPIMWISGHVLTLELFGKEFRKSIAMVKDFFAPMSELVLVIIIYTTRHWTYIHLWAGVACLLPLPLYFIVTESPRWLATNGKIKEAEEILTNIGIRNGKEITENQKIVIRKTLMNIQKEANGEEGKEDLNPLDMMRPTHYRKTLILLLNWVTIVVGVYTLSLNATKLSGDLFLNYSLAVLAGSLPGTFALLLTLRFFGRRFNLFYTQFILGMYNCRDIWCSGVMTPCVN